MAKRSIARKRRKCNVKKWVVTTRALLCPLGKVLRVCKVFFPLHDIVSFTQKTVVYKTNRQDRVFGVMEALWFGDWQIAKGIP